MFTEFFSDRDMEPFENVLCKKVLSFSLSTQKDWENVKRKRAEMGLRRERIEAEERERAREASDSESSVAV